MALFVLLGGVCFISVDSWSLWLDEAITAQMYSVGSFSELVGQFRLRDGSEAQMPGWILFMWGWVKLFGNGEYALRASNFVFMVLFLSYCYSLVVDPGRSRKERYTLMVTAFLSVCNPFILYNMNEARCNIPVFALSFVTVLSLLEYLRQGRKRDWYICLASFVIGCAFNMLVALLAVSLCILAKGNVGKFIRSNVRSLFLFSVPLLLLGGYYVSTLSGGKGGQIETPGIGNAGYAMYEFLGFSGLGPCKNLLRESVDKKSLLLSYVPYILPLLVSYCAIFVLMLKLRRREWLGNTFLWAFVGGFIVFFGVAYVVGFRFWGRHLLFLYPLWLLFMGETLCQLYLENGRMKMVGWGISLFFALCLLCSSSRILFDGQYKKEDIKGVVEKCRQYRQSGEAVFWSESEDTSLYYGLTDPLVKNGFPDEGDSGLFVWFKRRMAFGDGKVKYEHFTGTSNPYPLYEDKDCIIYRFAPSR